MTIKEALDKTTIFFKEKNFESPRLDAEILLSSALNLKRIDLYLKFENQMTESEIENCRTFVRRRASGEPIAYILRQKDFYNEVFYVDQNVLIPRPETELLVDEVLRWVHQRGYQNKSLQVLDLGTGSGCIGLSLIKKLPEAQATLVDISQGALNVAKKNAEGLGLSSRCECILKNAEELSIENKKFDIIISNPPYIDREDTEIMDAVKKFEPHQALFASDEGLHFLKSWSEKFSKYLSDHSIMVFEFGSKHGTKAEEWFQRLGKFHQIKIIKDFSGHDRHIFAEKISKGKE